jgi:outer membrane biosynthesis protein TonB
MHALDHHARFAQPSLWLLMLCLALLAGGCQKKPVHPVPAVLAPAIETEPAPAPPPPSLPSDSSTSAAPPETNSAPANTAQKPRPKPRRPAPRKPPQQPAATSQPEPAKPATPDTSVQITADVPRAAVQTQRQNTEKLLRSSENKLASVTRGLSDGEQGMLRQARNYIAQSNQALQAGDVERAYNLAVKASLLANELAK